MGLSEDELSTEEGEDLYAYLDTEAVIRVEDSSLEVARECTEYLDDVEFDSLSSNSKISFVVCLELVEVSLLASYFVVTVTNSTFSLN